MVHALADSTAGMIAIWVPSWVGAQTAGSHPPSCRAAFHCKARTTGRVLASGMPRVQQRARKERQPYIPSRACSMTAMAAAYGQVLNNQHCWSCHAPDSAPYMAIW